MGAAYVFQEPPSGWGATGTPVAELTASDGAANNQLGTAVATDGTTIAAGDSPDTASGKGVYVWTMPTNGWSHEPSAPNATQTAALSASDNYLDNAVGTSLAVSGDTIAAGAYNHKIPPTGFVQGAVYVWTMPTAGWAAATGAAANQAAELTVANAPTGATLGASVAIDGNAIVAGAPQEADGNVGNGGAVYVFVEPSGGWKSEPAYPGANQTDELAINGAAEGDSLRLEREGSELARDQQGVSIPVPHVAKCPAATGKLSGGTLGPLHLGMTRAQALHAYKRSSNRGSKYKEFFCLTPNRVRVGLASPAELKTLPKHQRGKYLGRVIWISTSSPYYAANGIRAGATVAAAGTSMAILKVRHGIVEELGIGDKVLLRGRKAQQAFLRSFS